MSPRPHSSGQLPATPLLPDRDRAGAVAGWLQVTTSFLRTGGFDGVFRDALASLHCSGTCQWASCSCLLPPFCGKGRLRLAPTVLASVPSDRSDIRRETDSSLMPERWGFPPLTATAADDAGPMSKGQLPETRGIQLSRFASAKLIRHWRERRDDALRFTPLPRVLGKVSQ
jgi:hypothetical protein